MLVAVIVGTFGPYYVCSKRNTLLFLFLKFESNLFVKRFFFLLNATLS